MTSKDWDQELKKIDRQLEKLSDEELLSASKTATPAEHAKARAVRRETSTFGVFARLVLAVALAIGVLFWPYAARCGVGLLAYLGVTVAVTGAGVWTAIWTWRHRAARPHILSLLLIVWGIVLAAVEVLPRVGYARPDARHPAIWMCP
jgi:hypothetical protein